MPPEAYIETAGINVKKCKTKVTVVSAEGKPPVVGTYKQTLSGGPAGTIEETGKYIAVLKRTDGVWKLPYLMHNSDHPVMSPGAGSTH